MNFRSLRLRAGAYTTAMGDDGTIPPPPPPPDKALVQFDSASARVTLSATSQTTVTFTVNRSEVTDVACSVSYSWTSDAAAGLFVAEVASGSGTVSFASGETSKSVTIQVKKVAPGEDKTITMTLTAGTASEIGTYYQKVITLVKPVAGTNPAVPDESFTVTSLSGTALDVLRNATERASVTSVTVTANPTGGTATVRSSDLKVIYDPDDGAADGSTDTFTIQVQPGGDTSTVTVTRDLDAPPSSGSGWGTGPKSGFRYWIGCRAHGANGFLGAQIAQYEADTFSYGGHTWQGVNRKMDVIDVWVPHGDMKALKTPSGAMDPVKQWDWISGCTTLTDASGNNIMTDAQRNDHTRIGGSFNSQWSNLWRTDFRQQPVKFNISPIPIALSTESRGLAVGSVSNNWQIWFDFARGDAAKMVIFKRLGKRFAYKDHQALRQSGALASHINSANNLPHALTMVNWAWECNMYQHHSFQHGKSPSTASSPYPADTWTYSIIGDAFKRMVEAFNEGYLSYTGWDGGVGKNCPYFHGTRPVMTKTAGKTFKEILWSWQHHGTFKWIGQSQHNNQVETRPISDTNPATNNGLRVGTNNHEGLNSIGELASKHNWKVWLDETGHHAWGAWSDKTFEYYDYWLKAIHQFFVDNPDLCGGWSFYQGETSTAVAGAGIPNVCNTSLIVNGYKGVPVAERGRAGKRWEQANQFFLNTFRKNP